MRELYVIGIGAGDPEQVTVQAMKALRAVEVFFVLGKGAEKQELLAVRDTILAEYAAPGHRVVEIPDPPRDRDPGDYQRTVLAWHAARAELLEQAFTEVDGVGGILVWGDPALYDSTLRIVETILERGKTTFDYQVIPGITSVHALAAAHRTVLHRIGEPVQITTGRRLAAEGLNPGSTVVMLDATCAFTNLPPETHIWWGAYLGMPDETLISGTIGEVAEDIVRRRTELRAAKGWIMDIYLLRTHVS